MEEEEKELVSKAKSGDSESFSKLYSKYYSTIHYTIYMIVKNDEVTNDLSSVVFTKAWNKISSFVDNISFKMWLKTIATNTAIDFLRRTKNENLNKYIDDTENYIQLADDSKSPEEEYIIKEKARIIMQLIPKLRKKYRDLINMKLDGLSYKQIAESVNSTELAVKSDLSKARKRLKQLYHSIN